MSQERLEYPPFVHPTGITPGYLKTLLSRFGRANKVRLRALFEDWRGLDLPETSLYRILMVTGLPEVGEHCDFYRFLAVACGFFGNVSRPCEEDGGKTAAAVRPFVATALGFSVPVGGKKYGGLERSIRFTRRVLILHVDSFSFSLFFSLSASRFLGLFLRRERERERNRRATK